MTTDELQARIQQDEKRMREAFGSLYGPQTDVAAAHALVEDIRWLSSASPEEVQARRDEARMKRAFGGIVAWSQTPALRAQMVEEDAIRGLLVPFRAQFAGNRDAYNTRFSKEHTDFMPDLLPPDARPVLWHHGQDDQYGAQPIGRVRSMTVDDEGLWATMWLDRQAKYFDSIRKMVEAGKAFLSSGALAHLARISRSGEVEVWPVVEASLTPVPASIFAVISQADFRSHCTRAGITLSDSQLRAISDGQGGN